MHRRHLRAYLARISLAMPLILTACGRRPAGYVAASCTLDPVASFPVDLTMGAPVITLNIQSQPEHMVVVTASPYSFLFQSSVDNLRRQTPVPEAGFFNKWFSTSKAFPNLVNPSVTFGTLTLKSVPFRVSSHPAPPPSYDPQIDGVIGLNILSRFDLALDFPARTLSLYKRQNCSNPDLPWSDIISVKQITVDAEGAPLIPVSIEGHDLKFLFDTGAQQTLVHAQTLQAYGINPLGEALTGGYFSKDFEDNPFNRRIAEFHNVIIGGVNYQNAQFLVDTSPSDDAPSVAGWLGNDYISRHHIYLDNATQRLYLSP